MVGVTEIESTGVRAMMRMADELSATGVATTIGERLRARVTRAMMLVIVFAGATAIPTTAQQLPQLLAEGVISTAQIEYGPAFSPSGDTLYFTRRAPGVTPGLWQSVRSGSGWGDPQPVSFSSEYGDEYPSVSPDGQHLYFASVRPVNGVDPQDRNDLWVAHRTASGWSQPEHLGGDLSTPDVESHPVVTEDGLYFHSRREGGEGGVDAWFAPGPPGSWGPPVPLPFNSSATDGEVVLSPDGGTAVFYSDRPGGHGRGDLYRVDRTATGWGPPRNLGSTINSSAWDWTPTFSPDGRTLVFSRLLEDSSDADLWIVSFPPSG